MIPSGNSDVQKSEFMSYFCGAWLISWAKRWKSRAHRQRDRADDVYCTASVVRCGGNEKRQKKFLFSLFLFPCRNTWLRARQSRGPRSTHSYHSSSSKCPQWPTPGPEHPHPPCWRSAAPRGRGLESWPTPKPTPWTAEGPTSKAAGERGEGRGEDEENDKV